MPEYGQKEYWEGRYKGLRTVGSGGGGQPEDTRDWYMGYATLKAVLKPHLKSSEVQVLFVGCGMSELPEQLHDAGFKRIVGVDYVQSLVEWMKWRNKKRGGLLYLAADLTDATAGLPVSDLIVDKAALDAIVCTHHSRDKAASAVLNNVYRALKPGGTYMLISHAGPDDRLGLLQKLEWDIQVKSLERKGLSELIKAGGPPKAKVSSVDLEKAVKNEEDVYFMYLCRKPELPGSSGAPD